VKLQKIPKGVLAVRIANYSDKDAKIFLNKKIFELIKSRQFIIWNLDIFCQLPPLKEFPQWQLYSNVKLNMEFAYVNGKNEQC